MWQGSFWGTAVHIVAKLLERIGAAFPLLVFIRTHCGRHCEPFFGQKFTRLRNTACTISKFIRGTSLVPGTNFRLARQRSIVPVLRNDHWKVINHKLSTNQQKSKKIYKNSNLLFLLLWQNKLLQSTLYTAVYCALTACYLLGININAKS